MNEQSKKQSFFELFPNDMKALFASCLDHFEEITEIRFRVNQGICVYIKGKECYIDASGEIVLEQSKARLMSKTEIEHFIAHACDFSPYAFHNELGNGYITAKGGHRIGVVGELLVKQDGSLRMKHICFVNIRVAHEILGAANMLLPHLYVDHSFQSTIIASAPGAGKTTMLRDLIRQLSDGSENRKGMKVAVVDERSEIAGCYLGVPQNQIGARTDVLDGCEKARGIRLLIRSMSPELIAVDELAGEEELSALAKAFGAGCKFLLTMHTDNVENLMELSILQELQREKMIQRIILLKEKQGKRRFTIYDQKGELLCSN